MDFKNVIRESISKQDQQIFVKFCLLKDYSTYMIHSELTKFLGSLASPKKTIEKWVAKYRKGERVSSTNIGGDRSDQVIRQQRIEKIESCFEESRHWSLRSLASTTGIPLSTLSVILKRDLKMKKKLGKWVPHKLTNDQQNFRSLCCRVNLQTYQKTKSLLKRTLTIDETWVKLYMEPDRDQRRQWLKEGEQIEPTLCENTYGQKRMLIMAMDFDGIAYYELLPERQTVNAEVYIGFLSRLLAKWLGRKDSKGVWLLHDNARPHVARVVKDFLDERGISTWEQPGYSPDISPLDFCCFGQLKRRLKGIEHHNWREFEIKLELAVKNLNDEGKMDGVQHLPSRWQRVIDANGFYF